MPKHLDIPHYDQTEDALNYVLMEDWWGAPQDGIIQGKQASVGDALNKVRAKIMIYLRTDLHFWSPPIWVYSGLHLLWWYMQPRWWSKWCLVLALQWPFPVGDGGREEDKGKKNDKLSWKSDVLTPSSIHAGQTALYGRRSPKVLFIHFYMACTVCDACPHGIRNSHSIKSTLPVAKVGGGTLDM